MKLSSTDPSSQRIVLIAGSLSLARELEQGLHAAGCEVCETVGTVREAAQRCARRKPSALLFDVQHEAAQTEEQLAELSTTARAPLVAVCAGDVDLPLAAARRASALLDPPFTAKRVARVLRLVQGQAARSTPALDQATTKRERFRDELLASIAHELRAPLQGVVGFAAFLIEDKAGSVSHLQREYLQHIASGANHALQVVQDVLDLSVSSADTLHVRTEVVDPEQALREVLQVLQVIAIRKRVEISVEVDERLGHVVSDATKLKQILYNFASNALKFTPAAGHISVKLYREDPDAFCIEVADSGTGMTDAALADLLTAVQTGSSRPQQGFGLMLTQRIIDALGGSMHARNRPEGGCVFVAHLPLAPAVSRRTAQEQRLRHGP